VSGDSLSVVQTAEEERVILERDVLSKIQRFQTR